MLGSTAFGSYQWSGVWPGPKFDCRTQSGERLSLFTESLIDYSGNKQQANKNSLISSTIRNLKWRNRYWSSWDTSLSFANKIHKRIKADIVWMFIPFVKKFWPNFYLILLQRDLRRLGTWRIFMRVKRPEVRAPFPPFRLVKCCQRAEIC